MFSKDRSQARIAKTNCNNSRVTARGYERYARYKQLPECPYDFTTYLPIRPPSRARHSSTRFCMDALLPKRFFVVVGICLWWWMQNACQSCMFFLFRLAPRCGILLARSKGKWRAALL